MQYQILILLAKDKIAAMDIGTDGRVEIIYFEGNESMEYESGEEMRDFCLYLKDYYNIEDFSDLDMSASIIKFDALSDNALCLFEEIKSAKECNLISIEKLLPLLVLKDGLVKPDVILQVEIFGIVYSINISNDLKFECKQGESGNKQLRIPIERLSLYYNFDGNNLIDNKQELKKCQEEFRNELDCKETVIQKLEHELQAEKARADAAVEKAERMLEQKNCNTKRYVCKFDKKNLEAQMKARNPYVGGVVDTIFRRLDLTDDWQYRISYAVRDCDVVKQHQKIAVAQAYYGNERMSSCDCVITAVEGGRFYCLMSLNATIKDGDAVALIGDLSDTKEDVMSWYEKNK